MKIGIIWVGYQCADEIANSLSAWEGVRYLKPDGHEFVVCCVSVPFKAFQQPERPDQTVEMLQSYLAFDEIDHLITSEKPLSEVEARGAALKWLVTQGVDALWQVDSDEVYTQEQILKIVKFTEANPFSVWFRLSLKNYVFDSKTYLVEPFTPPRIHRVDIHAPRVWTADAFWDDNNVFYLPSSYHSYPSVRDIDLPSMTAPPSVASIRHYSWLSNLRSKKKVEYQLARGWKCSFKWEDVGGLSFDESYYTSRGLPLPEIAQDQA